MASELRWILGAICVPLLFAIWWWSARRSSQGPGNPELRESGVTTERDGSHDPGDASHTMRVDATASFGGARDWSVSPLQPLSIRTADFESAEPDDLPMSAYPPGVDTPGVATPGVATPHVAAPAAAEPFAVHSLDIPVLQVADAVEEDAVVAPTEAALPGPSASPPSASASAPMASIDTSATGSNRQAPNVSEMQRIVGVRVCAAGAVPWDGAALMAALEAQGMAFGRYQVFHRRHGDGRSLFCAASLVEPGTFNLSHMARQQFLGLTLFAVLPGPGEPVQTFDALIRTAVGLAKDLHGTVQDSTGVLLSPERLEELREDVARFQALLTSD